MSKRILFVYPALSVGGFGALANPNIPDGCYSSHGLMSLSACLKAAGHETTLLDLRGLTGWEKYETRVVAAEYDLALVSYLTPDAPHGERAIETLKRIHPTRPVAVGGLHVTLTHDAGTLADYVIWGQGERAVVELASSGLKNGDRLFHGVPLPVTDLPIPDRDLFCDTEIRRPIFAGLPTPQVTILAGRGCGHRCAFCYQSEERIFGYGTMRPLRSVIRELEGLYARYEFKSIMFHDDNQWAPSFLSPLAREIRNRWPGVRLWMQMHPGFVCAMRSLVEELRGAGLEWLSLGLESGSQRMLDLVAKGSTVAQNLEASKICTDLGIRIFANYMFGLPGETEGDMQATVEMIREIRPARHSPNLYVSFPGTALYRQCLTEGLFVGEERFIPGNPWARKIRGIDYQLANQLIAELME